jgi:hypothetical protein
MKPRSTNLSARAGGNRHRRIWSVVAVAVVALLLLSAMVWLSLLSPREANDPIIALPESQAPPVGAPIPPPTPSPAPVQSAAPGSAEPAPLQPPGPAADVAASPSPRPSPSADVAASAPPHRPSAEVAASAPPRRPFAEVAAGEPLPIDDPVTASRLFAGPDQFPPQDFGAYGILAFRSRAASQDRPRHLLICEAYVTSLPHASELSVEPTEQMVTVWPVDSHADADRLNLMSRTKLCDFAVDNYGLVTSLRAIKDAELANTDADISGIGPFLLAWSPSTDKGKKDVLVLVSNLSGVTTYRQAQELLARWSRAIEQNPQLWRRGWDLEKLRVEIRLWVDEYGPRILTVFGSKD